MRYLTLSILALVVTGLYAQIGNESSDNGDKDPSNDGKAGAGTIEYPVDMNYTKVELLVVSGSHSSEQKNNQIIEEAESGTDYNYKFIFQSQFRFKTRSVREIRLKLDLTQGVILISFF